MQDSGVALQDSGVALAALETSVSFWFVTASMSFSFVAAFVKKISFEVVFAGCLTCAAVAS